MFERVLHAKLSIYKEWRRRIKYVMEHKHGKIGTKNKK